MPTIATAPLPPQSTKEAYQAYLQSIHWLMLRDKCLERDNHRCTKCASKLNVQVHHLTYRQSWYDTQIEDLTALCQACHRAEHGLPPFPTRKRQPKPPGRITLKRQRLAKKANWNAQAKAHLYPFGHQPEINVKLRRRRKQG